MSFEGLLGNEGALRRLQGLLERGRLAHAYLFSGPEGVGKRHAAALFARAMGVAPLIVTRPEDRHEILISQVHEVIREFSFAARGTRVVIFDDAHRMSEEAMNALLKTLEEPPPGAVIILVTHVPDRLLPTLRSRCQTVLFHPLSDAEVARYAGQTLGLEESQARVLATLSGGSVGVAAGLAPDLEILQARLRELQERALSGELNPLIESLGKIRDTEQARRAAKRDLRLLALCLREALLAPLGAPPVLATPPFVERLARLDPDDLLDRIETLLDHERLIDLNANVSLVVEDALLRME